jgi:hypothetical protein
MSRLQDNQALLTNTAQQVEGISFYVHSLDYAP